MKKSNNKKTKDLKKDDRMSNINQYNTDSLFENTLKNLKETNQILLILNKLLEQRPDYPEEMVKATRSILIDLMGVYDINKDFRYLN